MRSLVVDPSLIAQRILSNFLRQAGCDEICVARGMTEALQQWEEGPAASFDLVITESDLADGNGLELTRRIRERADLHPAILVHTTRNSREEVLAAIQAGADGYLLKPPDSETLRMKFEQLLDPARTTQSRAAA